MELTSPRGKLVIATCNSGKVLAGSVLKLYESEFAAKRGSEEPIFLEGIDFRFRDSEVCVRLNADVSGSDVFLFQGLYDPGSGDVDSNIMALLAAIRTFREWGARHITVVAPYLAYARQDRPSRGKREPTTIRLVADLLIEAGLDGIITAHPHIPIHALVGKIPVHSIDTADIFSREFGSLKGLDDVVGVAPDGGALKFVTRLNGALEIKTAVALKERAPDGSISSELVGDLEDKTTAIVLDDMINSGETVYVLVRKLAALSIAQIIVAATHNLCMDSARDYLINLHSHWNLKQVIVTDSIAQSASFLSLPFLKVKTLADAIASVIHRVHSGRPLEAS